MIRATYSSNVFKTNDDFFESISIDLKRTDERHGFALTMFRQIERQCFGYDDNNVFMVTPDEWSYFEEGDHELYNITRNHITKKLNEITTWAVQKFDVDDVRPTNSFCVMVRREKNIPFSTERSIENILLAEHMADFEGMLHDSFGRHKTRSILKFFRTHYPDLPKSAAESFEEREVAPSQPQQSYATWGEWA